MFCRREVFELREPVGHKLRLWTVQRREAWELLRETGHLHADERYVPREFLSAYRWMADQMRRRLPGCSGRLPVWAWYRPKPDLRRSGHLERGVPGIRLELLVSADRVLLSDFDAWHCVLNRWYLALTEEERARWESRLPRGYRPGDRLPLELEREMEASWERIFDLELLAASEWAAGGQRVQAALERIDLADVVGVKEFTAR